MMKNTIGVGLLVGVTAITVVSFNIAISGEEKNIDFGPFEPLAIDTKQNSHLIEDSFPGHTRNWSIQEDPLLFIHEAGSTPAPNRFLPDFPESIDNIQGTIILKPGDLTISESIIENPGSHPGLNEKDIWIEVGGGSQIG